MEECEKCQEHSGLVAEVKFCKKETEDQWTAINNLRNRLPTWATITISLLTFLLGCSLTFAALADRISHGGTE
jgi:hypothetical protein